MLRVPSAGGGQCRPAGDPHCFGRMGSRPDQRPRRAPTVLFAATVAANAGLLFTVEPLVSRQLLPLLGGTPSVWNTCLVAFQALLLAGYLYAHLLDRLSPPRTQAIVHLGLVAAAGLTLPAVVPRLAPPDHWPPAAWVLALLAAAVGAPFLVLAAGAPLLQRWYAAAADQHPKATPYTLYAASNAGSLVALLAYPLLIEPRVGLAAQARFWTWGYVLLAVALAACAARVGGAVSRGPVADAPAAAPAVPPRSPDRLRWTALAFVPSALLLGVTRYLSTDVAPVPLLWVGPLAIYLLTFVAAFAERARVPDRARDAAFALVTPILAILVALGANSPLWAVSAAHLAAFGVAALTCHQLLADRRPAVAFLTEYYLWIAAGGLLGGVFDALVAPAVFSALYEYPVAVALAAAAWWIGHDGPRAEPGGPAPIPRRTIGRRVLARLASDESHGAAAPAVPTALVAATPLVAGLLLYAAAARLPLFPGMRNTLPSAVAGGVAALLTYALRRRRGWFALAVAGLVVGGLAGQRTRATGVLARVRSFYGAYTVRASATYHHLQHGNTLHGAQDTRAAHRTTPLTYYHAGGPLGGLFTRVPRLVDGAPPRRVAVVGLGTGTLACWGRAGERWTFYEVDPLMAHIARDARLFTYLRDCPPRSDVILGDARLTIARAPRAAYDLILLDAFSSDAIPTHLLTREAFALYLDRLAPRGVLAVHVSNRYLRLGPVVARLAADAGVAAATGQDLSGASRRHVFLSSSSWIAVARTPDGLGTLAAAPGWRPLPAPGAGRPWTDDYTDVLSAVRWR